MASSGRSVQYSTVQYRYAWSRHFVWLITSVSDPTRPDPSQQHQQEPQHAADVFSLRRIDLPATVLGGAAAPTPRSARGVSTSASQITAVVRTILHVRSLF